MIVAILGNNVNMAVVGFKLCNADVTDRSLSIWETFMLDRAGRLGTRSEKREIRLVVGGLNLILISVPSFLGCTSCEGR